MLGVFEGVKADLCEVAGTYVLLGSPWFYTLVLLGSPWFSTAMSLQSCSLGL